jgi:hypothetical protein
MLVVDQYCNQICTIDEPIVYRESERSSHKIPALTVSDVSGANPRRTMRRVKLSSR